MKHLEGIELKLPDLVLGNGFLGMTPKAQTNQRKNRLKNTIKEVKR